MKLLLASLILALLAVPSIAQDNYEHSLKNSIEKDRRAMLAMDYLEGNDVQQSDVEALKWWIAAQAIDYPVIERLTPETPFICGTHRAAVEQQLSALERRATPNQFAEAGHMAREWLEAHPQ